MIDDCLPDQVRVDHGREFYSTLFGVRVAGLPKDKYTAGSSPANTIQKGERKRVFDFQNDPPYRRPLLLFGKSPKGGFLLFCNFDVRTHVNKIEAMYKRSRVNVNVEPRLRFTYARKISRQLWK